MEKAKMHSVLGQVFLIVFLDIVGFSILFPFFPAMLEHYLTLEGPGSGIGRLVEWLAGFAGEDANATAALFGGVLGSLYSILQFAFAPFWGSLSDRIGRRPTLLVTLVGTLVAYVVWVFAGTFALLIVSRFLGGIAAGNISTASAVVADVTKGADRAKGMGMLGMGIGLGFVCGPAIGALASRWNLVELWGGAEYGINPFSSAALIACGLAVINLVYVGTKFPETCPPDSPSKSGERRPLNPFRALGDLRFPGVGRTNVLYFTYLTAFAAIEFTLTFLAVERFAFSPADNGWMFVFVGLTIAFVQGGLIRRLAPRYGERRLAIGGLALTLPGFLLVGWADGMALLYGGLAFMAVGSACVMPSLSALISRYSPADRQGLALGTFRSMGSLSRAVGPIVGGLAYWRFGSEALYVAAGLFLLLPLTLSRGLPPVPALEDDNVEPQPKGA